MADAARAAPEVRVSVHELWKALWDAIAAIPDACFPVARRTTESSDTWYPRSAVCMEDAAPPPLSATDKQQWVLSIAHDIVVEAFAAAVLARTHAVGRSPVQLTVRPPRSGTAAAVETPITSLRLVEGTRVVSWDVAMQDMVVCPYGAAVCPRLMPWTMDNPDIMATFQQARDAELAHKPEPTHKGKPVRFAVNQLAVEMTCEDASVLTWAAGPPDAKNSVFCVSTTRKAFLLSEEGGVDYVTIGQLQKPHQVRTELFAKAQTKKWKSVIMADKSLDTEAKQRTAWKACEEAIGQWARFRAEAGIRIQQAVAACMP